MKEYKYTIDGKEYKVEIGDINENVADVTVNGETITAVRIDGKKFFGNDVQSATKCKSSCRYLC